MKRGLRDLGNIRSIFSSTSIRNVFSLWNFATSLHSLNIGEREDVLDGWWIWTASVLILLKLLKFSIVQQLLAILSIGKHCPSKSSTYPKYSPSPLSLESGNFFESSSKNIQKNFISKVKAF
jgi:hypothetical protein